MAEPARGLGLGQTAGPGGKSPAPALLRAEGLGFRFDAREILRGLRFVQGARLHFEPLKQGVVREEIVRDPKARIERPGKLRLKQAAVRRGLGACRCGNIINKELTIRINNHIVASSSGRS